MLGAACDARAESAECDEPDVSGWLPTLAAALP